MNDGELLAASEPKWPRDTVKGADKCGWMEALPPLLAVVVILQSPETGEGFVIYGRNNALPPLMCVLSWSRCSYITNEEGNFSYLP